MKLPRLLNKDFEYVASVAAMSGIALDQCPTCLNKPERVGTDDFVVLPGTFRFRGEEVLCDCETQKLLRKHYLLANIPTQYMVLDWERDYHRDERVRERVHKYLEEWQFFRASGMGMEFSGKAMGTGKTFAATHIGKELVKSGEGVYFIDFKDVIGAYDSARGPEIEERLRTTTVLILDEVVAPFTTRQQDFFAFKFEELIRFRTNFNLITLMTTNLEPDELRAAYPRTYSLLEAKQIRTEMNGEDARQTDIAVENMELAMNREVRPLS